MAWLGSHDFISPSMNRNMDNAEGITDKYIQKLTEHQGDDAGILNLLNLVTPKGVQLINLRIKYSGDIGSKLAQSEDQNAIFGDMSENLTEAFNLVVPIHGKGTLEFNTIYANGTDELYNGKYLNKITALGGLSTLMNNNGCNAAGTIISNYRTTIMNRHATQQNDIHTITDDMILEKQLAKALGLIINQGRGWLMYHFGGQDDFESIVDSYFALNLLQDKSTGHYQRMIPAASFRRMCIHIFKTGEKAEIIIGAKDCWIATADDANHPIANGYKALAGSHVTIDPLMLGDPAKKFIIATNTDLTDSTDVIFNIVKP